MRGAILSLLALVAYFSACNSSPLTPQADEPDVYRLDQSFKATNYKIHLTLAEDFFTKKIFSGSVIINVKREDPEAKMIRIHRAKEMKLSKLFINDTEIVLNKIKYIEATEIMEIDLPAAVTDTFTMNFLYQGILYTDMYGFYLSNYKTDDVTNYIATTQFQPTFARRAFPCFDEPSFKAIFQITLTVPEGYQALSNQNQLLETFYEANTYEFAPTPPMSTYLVAFVVSKFESTPVTPTNSSFPMNVWAPPHLLANANYAAKISRKIIDNLGKLLSAGAAAGDAKNVEFEKMGIDHLDQVAIPDFVAGAMENWGLVTYRESALLWNEGESKVKDKERVATVIAHEFAHSWFGNWVTTKWWDNTWLNEGFATYFQHHGLDDVDLDYDFELKNQFVVNVLQPILETDGNSGALSLSSAASNVSEVKGKFGTISYDKGASIIRMMAKMDKTNFLKNLNNYINHNRNGSTEPEDLFKEFNAKFEKFSFDTIMTDWIDKSGYPLITVELNDGKVKVSQKPFFYEKPEHGVDTKWYVPIKYEIISKNDPGIPTTTTLAPTRTTTTLPPTTTTLPPTTTTLPPTTTTLPPTTTTGVDAKWYVPIEYEIISKNDPETPTTTTLATTRTTATLPPTTTTLPPTTTTLPPTTTTTLPPTTTTLPPTTTTIPPTTTTLPPITTTSPPKPSTKTMLLKPGEDGKLSEKISEEHVILVNMGSEGYYRVKYAGDLMTRIIAQLKTEHTKIDVITRAQLVDDALNLARAGEIEYKTSLELVEYLTNETDYYPWKSALTAFSYLRKRLVNDPLRDTISQKMNGLMKNFYNDNEKLKDNTNSAIDIYKHVLALEWGCELELENCTKLAKQEFDKLIPTTRSEPIDANIRSIVYCSALRHAEANNRDKWTLLWDTYKGSDIVSEKLTILTALGCTKDEDLLKDYLEMSLNDSSIRPQDANSVFRAVLTGNPEGIQISLEFLIQQFKRIGDKYGSMGALSNVILEVADRLTTNDQLTKFQTFVDENREHLNEAALVADNAIIAAKANIAWADTYKSKLKEVLDPHYNGAASLIGTGMIGILLCALISRIL